MRARKRKRTRTCIPTSTWQGTLACSRNLCRIGGHPQHVLARTDYASISAKQVVLISGGGSGHEPAHAGFIGEGMLTGAVLGGVFASPSSAAVLSAIKALAGPPGCLLIVKNYTGDRLNFGIAMEKARAAGIKCEMCIVGDDCALPKDKGITGRRGIAGTLFVHKCAGAAAAAGKNLEQVTAEARAAADSVASMGVALTTCTLPGAAPNPRLDGDLVEIGLGIHGEPGAEQCKWRPCDDLVDEALKSILDPIKGGDDQPYLAPAAGSQVAVLINSLGGTPPMEIAVIGRRIVESLTARGLVVARCASGALMTSLDMAGFSVSLLLLTPERASLLDAPTSAPAWPVVHDLTAPAAAAVADPLSGESSSALSGSGLEPAVAAKVKSAAEALVAAEPQLTEWDMVAGDGDCGITMKRGASRVLQDMAQYPSAADGALLALAESVKESMGGERCCAERKRSGNCCVCLRTQTQTQAQAQTLA